MKAGMNSKSHSRQGQHAPLSLETFAQRKGQVRALEEFHKRKNVKRVETAKALRGYRRAMKQEGFEAGKGASRKRAALSEDSPPINGNAATMFDGRNASGNLEADTAKGRKKRRMNPFQKSLQKAEKNKANSDQQKHDKMKRGLDRKQKLKERKSQSKLLAKRTRKGQPIMKNMADNILVKLRKQTS
eukprot:CAMPEP_0117016424 /NCGR_PEP_ID=MMETSP0472-20121206/12955_1 /TAXON_ID=693140 ORGANISM="Tiarina fusus, Strain LIS" /NCGR_SAMPLE_ID=MMETSP0472 /ASSEMBLY_ACC=CAM_ASM_000603 /LENGTH=186 /DNA_ID=CAMNT_0004720481 /DNA_START=32 /DNA_END=592 /DNA_ORIENTATION=+